MNKKIKREHISPNVARWGKIYWPIEGVDSRERERESQEGGSMVSGHNPKYTSAVDV